MKNLFTQKPDIAKDELSPLSTTLDQVGMTDVELPIMVSGNDGKILTLPARLDLWVSLDDPHAKGIHMSRLYLKAKEHLASHILNFKSLAKLTDIFLETHQDLSFSSAVSVSFDYMLERPALISSEKGWRFYPIKLAVRKNPKGIYIYNLNLEITYSSTCPCSAALARQINTEKFLEDFSKNTVVSVEDVADWLSSRSSQTAVPHAQRSNAEVQVTYTQAPEFNQVENIIDSLEKALGTPVQAAVKREDEQEFARLNGSNMMFSEDACRRLKMLLEQDRNISNYNIKVNHQESLHPHNAVAIASK